MTPKSSPSETSPLLAGHENGFAKANGLVGDSSIADATPSLGPDIERRSSRDSARDAQFAGMPEVRKRLKYIVPTISIGIFLAAADQTIIVSSYGKIGSELQALQLTSWIATSYFLTLTSFQPLYGKLSDIFGRKTCLLWAYGIFCLGGLFCGLSQDIKQLIAARAFQGIGGGGMTTVVSIMMSDIVPLKERGVWQGIINIVFASGAACGAPLGGAFADYLSWRWAFLFQVPLCLLAFAVVVPYLNLPRKEPADWRTNLRRIDFLGALFLVFAIFSLLLGLDRGSNVAWSLPISYGPLVGSIVLFAVFLVIETKFATEPFAPGHIIFNRNLFASYACNFFSFAGAMAAIYYLPLFFQAVDGSSATASGFRLLPATFSGVCGSLFGGWYMKKTGKYYWITAIFYWFMSFGLFLVILFTGVITTSYPALVVAMVFTFFGNGVGVTTTLIALIRNAAPEDQAIATACSYLFRSLGSVVGVALSATTVQQSLRAFLRDALSQGKDADKIVEGVRQSLDFINTLSPAVRNIVRHCYGVAIRNGFGFMFGISIFSALSAFMIVEKTLE